MRKIKRWIYLSIGTIEILIGASTFIFSILINLFRPGNIHVKSLNVYVYVVCSALASFVLGVSLLKKRDWARVLLIFFSGFIILEKILIFSGLMVFNGELLTQIPVWTKDIISVFYHSAVLILLAVFGKKGPGRLSENSHKGRLSSR